MAKLVLHIGTHKTGTTAIQGTLDCNRSLLQRNGVIYPWFASAKKRKGSTVKRLWATGWNYLAQTGLLSPVIGSSTGHHGLLSPWIELPEDMLTATPPMALLKQLSEAHANSARSVLLSSEEFSRSHAGRNGKGPDLAEIRNKIAPFREIQIVCFLRHQIPFLQSLYLELSKTLVPPDPDKLCAQAIRSGYGAGMFMDFNLLRDRLVAAFPSDQLTFIDYGHANQSPQGVTGALLGVAGHGAVASKLHRPGKRRANVSQPPLAVWVANQITESKLPRRTLLNLVKATLRDHYGPNPDTTIFTREERSRMAAHFKPLNQAFVIQVAADHPSSPQPFQLSDPAPGPLIYREDLDTSFWGDLNRAIGQDIS